MATKIGFENAVVFSVLSIKKDSTIDDILPFLGRFSYKKVMGCLNSLLEMGFILKKSSDNPLDRRHFYTAIENIDLDSFDKKFTYIIFSKSLNLYKIGVSKHPKLRLQNLRNEFKDAEILYLCNKNRERVIHLEYKDKNVFGEWFKLSNIDLDILVNNYNFKPVNNK